uniref:Uncharacterized protein n=1 Tax=Corethrella appendiculata TaxID=1370023 RepID=U5ED32_9DIPT
MVSIMDVEPNRQICDNRPTLSSDIGLDLTAATATATATTIAKQKTDTELAKRTMKLDLVGNVTSPTTTTTATTTTSSSTATSITTKHQKLKDRTFSDELGSPGSGRVSGRVLSHQTSISSQVDIVDDRKALRDALYQGIFHRHRRTIFAVGSFLRMLKSKNSQYNTIRSSSEGDDETR